jgi:hypothetical protein
MKQIFALIGLLFLSLPAFGQQPQTPEEQEKQLLEFIDKEVERLTSALNLEYWQTSYVDSTLVHDYHALQDEMKELQNAKVSNTDLYIAVQDKWQEQIYNTFHRFFNEDQWKKYLKTGAAREQKARDKRREKAAKAAAKEEK